MLNKLIALDQYIDDKYVHSLSYDVHFDGVEVVFKYYISLGWDTVWEVSKNFNACDYQTNIQGLEDEIKKIYNWFSENGEE